MIVTSFRGPKFLRKMLPVQEFDSKFMFEQTYINLNVTKNAFGSYVAIICDGNRLNH